LTFFASLLKKAISLRILKKNGLLKKIKMSKQEREQLHEEMRQRRRANGALHHFPNMDDSERLSYEKLDANNCEQLVTLFETEGENPYIDKRFQSIDAVKQYAQDLDDSCFEAKYGSFFRYT
jgi:hypothetical protein